MDCLLYKSNNSWNVVIVLCLSGKQLNCRWWYDHLLNRYYVKKSNFSHSYLLVAIYLSCPAQSISDWNETNVILEERYFLFDFTVKLNTFGNKHAFACGFKLCIRRTLNINGAGPSWFRSQTLNLNWWFLQFAHSFSNLKQRWKWTIGKAIGFKNLVSFSYCFLVLFLFK